MKLVEVQATKELANAMLPDIFLKMAVDRVLDAAPTVKAYTAHEVAEIIADLFGDTCACSFNGIDEWLPEKCELLDACPNTCGVACWEQYLKFRERKTE
jgi:hypothetical protein